MAVEFRRVLDPDEGVLYALIDAYLGEIAQHREISVGPTRAADYEYLPLYWTEIGRHPFLLVESDPIAGLVLVREVDRQRGRIAAHAEGPWAVEEVVEADGRRLEYRFRVAS